VLKWVPPPDDFVKINLDGAFDAESRSGGWGCVARNSDGTVIFAAAGASHNLSEALHSECIALMKAIMLAESYGMGRVIFSTDCACLKLATTSAGYDCSPLGTLFREIKYQLHLGFIEYRLELCPRLCNKPADVLACIGARENLLNHSVWLVDLPGDVARAVADDSVVTTS
jgi:hypothetical protein